MQFVLFMLQTPLWQSDAVAAVQPLWPFERPH
jgi:hypothetical protein